MKVVLLGFTFACVALSQLTAVPLSQDLSNDGKIGSCPSFLTFSRALFGIADESSADNLFSVYRNTYPKANIVIVGKNIDCNGPEFSLPLTNFASEVNEFHREMIAQTYKSKAVVIGCPLSYGPSSVPIGNYASHKLGEAQVEVSDENSIIAELEKVNGLVAESSGPVSVIVCVPLGSSSVLERALSLSNTLSLSHPSLVTAQCIDQSVTEKEMAKKRVVLEQMEVNVGQAQGNSSVVWPGSTDIANAQIAGWTGIVLILVTLLVIYIVCGIETGNDPLLYTKTKRD